jgi:AraC-like DNA-binding protein
MRKSLLKLNSLYIIIFGFLCTSLFAQTPINKHNLNKEVEELMYSNPNQAVKIANHLLSNPGITEEEKAKVNLLIAKTFYAKGDFSASLKSLFEENKYLDYLTVTEQVEVEVLKASIFRKLSLYKESEVEISDCQKLIHGISDENLTAEANSYLQIEKAKYYLLSDKLKEALEVLQKVKPDANGNLNHEISIWQNITLAKIYLEKKELQLSEDYFNKALQLSEKSKPVNLYAKTHALSGLASVYFLKKEHVKAGKLLDDSLKNSDVLNNLFLKEMVIRQQIVNYLALNDTTNYKLANKEFNKINYEADLLEEEATNVAYNLISDEYSENFEEAKSGYFNMLYGIISFLLVVILGGLVFWWRYYQRKKSLDEVIRYLEITRNNLINRYTEKEVIVKELPKRILIPQDTEKLILAKLKRFESTTRFTNKDISLAVLAGQFDTNTKYLSEIINTHYHVNFNTYINKLRINYLVEKLKSDPNYINYKISYLAEDCGFASHSSFATVFKSITGISPVTFIELLKEEKQAIAV